MRIGLCSPFNPLKSGISDFSEELVMALGSKVETVLFTPVPMSNQMLMAKFETHLISELDNKKLRDTLDLIVYHVGNNLSCHEEILKMLQKYPGILELHDISLHNLVAEKALKEQDWKSYIELAGYCHGSRGRAIANDFLNGIIGAPWETHPIEMFMNRNVIEQAEAVIVHSDYAKQEVFGIRADIPIKKIFLHSERIEQSPEQYQQECRAKMNIYEGDLVFGSFGFATESKRIIPILKAVSRYKKVSGKKMTYMIVGEAAKNLKLKEKLAEFEIEDSVLLTGHTTLEEFVLYMGACDFCLNLRYPTRGESSASLHRMLGMGKAVVVTDIGTFSEYPEDVVLKVRFDENEIEDIYQAIRLLAEDIDERERRSLSSIRFAEEYCDVEKNADQYVNYFEQLINHTWQPEWEDVIIGRLCELGLTDKEYTKHLFMEFMLSLSPNL